MKQFNIRCEKCNQSLDEEGEGDSLEYKYHFDVYDCLKSLVTRVKVLEDQAMAIQLPDILCHSTDPGSQSNTKQVAEYIKMLKDSKL